MISGLVGPFLYVLPVSTWVLLGYSTSSALVTKKILPSFLYLDKEAEMCGVEISLKSADLSKLGLNMTLQDGFVLRSAVFAKALNRWSRSYNKQRPKSAK